MNSTTLKRPFDARTAAKLTGDFITGLTLEIYLSQVQLRAAVERQLQKVGEALNAVRAEDPRVVDEIPDVHRYVARRNVIVHGYGSMDDDQVWDIAANETPKRIKQIDDILAAAKTEDLP